MAYINVIQCLHNASLNEKTHVKLSAPPPWLLAITVARQRLRIGGRPVDDPPMFDGLWLENIRIDGNVSIGHIILHRTWHVRISAHIGIRPHEVGMR